MTEPTAWMNTRAALGNFMQLLICNKCKTRPTAPVRFSGCQHLFCSSCVKQDTKCFTCGVPVRPSDKRVDHITSTLVSGCDKILNIIYSDGPRNENKEAEKESEGSEGIEGIEGIESISDNITNIFSSTRLSKDFVERKKIHKENRGTIIEESNDGPRNENKEAEKESEGSEGIESISDNITNIFSSTRLSKDFVERKKIHEENPGTIIEESNDGSDKTEKMENTIDDTVRLNDFDVLENLESTGNSLPEKTFVEKNKLKKPIRRSQTKSVKEPKKVPKNVNKTNRKGETLLHQACVKGQEETVRMLLDHGADPNTKDNANWTPLQETISLGFHRICEMLLEKGASTDTPGIDNKTALHEAVINNKYKEAELLLQYDANSNVFDQHGKKPIDYCTSDEMRKLLSQDNLLNETREKTTDLSTSLNRSIGSSVTKIVVLVCNLKKSTYASLSELALKHKLKITNSFVPSVTHVVVESDIPLFSTYDLLLSILHGKWILSSEWIHIGLSPECKNLKEMDLDIFEMKFLTDNDAPSRARLNAEKQNPGLFNNCYFYFALNPIETYIVGQISLTKKSLLRLSSEGGGSNLSREPNPEDIEIDKRIPFHVADNERHPLHNCSHYVIYAPGKEEPRIQYNMPHLKTLPLVWFIECIEKFMLVDPALFGIL